MKKFEDFSLDFNEFTVKIGNYFNFIVNFIAGMVKSISNMINKTASGTLFGDNTDETTTTGG